MNREPGDHHLPENVGDDSQAPLALTRTRSTDVNVVESGALSQPPLPVQAGVAVAEVPQDSWFPTRYRILLCAFLTSMSFGVTQVPLLYVFRLMTCDAYYNSQPALKQNSLGLWQKTSLVTWLDWYTSSISPYNQKQILQDPDDRCSIHAIESSTALAISLLGASTTVFGIFNLFLTGNLIKRIGVQRTLIIQVFFPAVRLLIQNVGVEVWGSAGILIVQCSQVASIIGGPSGYVLALNQFITEVVGYEQRTAELGRLAGTMLFGSAFGFLFGGVFADVFGIKIPFRLTLVLFLCSSLYVVLFLPDVTPPSASPADNTSSEESTSEPTRKRPKKSRNRFFGPLLVFAPRRFVLANGSIHTEYGAFLLACGVFLGILATGYLPTLLQLYSTDVFRFGTQQNGWLIFVYSTLRGVFLTFAFPKLIAMGRNYTSQGTLVSRRIDDDSEPIENSAEREPLLSGQGAVSHTPGKQTYKFDLVYTRFSIAADGILTLLCSLLWEGWQMYVVACILPFAAGTGSAAKGTVLQIVGATASSDERTDALAGISLVENMARLTTTFAFGVVFAGFTNMGRPELVFTVNAACALVAFIVLLFAHFPPENARLVDDLDEVPRDSTSI